ncbi:DUF58 domain-containing protein [Microbacterium awajiense]|uniref:DUF58 domain-containing protein n=1 Tax=Microbacterium awajiense TaxID=415214 RepID=A0ABP7B066_9MICO
MRRLWPLTVRGTGALVLAAACFIAASELGVIELMYFGMLLVAVVATSLASLYFARRIDTVSRVLRPEVATVGRESSVIVQVGVRTAVPTPPGRWHDTLPSALRGRADGVFPALGSGLRGVERLVELHYAVTGTQRGVHTIGPLALRQVDPFGLARRSISFGERSAVTVAPAVVDLPSLAEYAGATGGLLQATIHQLGQGADNLVARPYVPGDSRRRIHWRATAHRDELMVRQEEQESTPEASVVLDRGALRYSPDAMSAPGVDPGFEAAVSACVSAVARLVGDGYAVEVIDSDGTVLAERIDAGDTTEVEGVVAQFATVTARGDDHLARVGRLFAGVMTGPVVVITGRLDVQDATALAPVAHHSALPLLLAVAPREDALAQLGAYGWRTARIGADTDLAAAWAGAVDRENAHVA